MSEYLTRETATEELCNLFHKDMLTSEGRDLQRLIDAGWRILPPEPEWTVTSTKVDIALRLQGDVYMFLPCKDFTVEAVQAMADVLNGGDR